MAVLICRQLSAQGKSQVAYLPICVYDNHVGADDFLRRMGEQGFTYKTFQLGQEPKRSNGGKKKSSQGTGKSG